MPSVADPLPPTFEEFAEVARVRLRRALVARYGVERGESAAAEALAYAWEHWERVSEMHNPLGYLYRVAQSRTRRLMPPRRRVAFPAVEAELAPLVEPGLPRAIAQLTPRQRVAVVLVHGYDWTHKEVADLMGSTPSTVSTHVARGLKRLREDLGVTDD